MVDFAHLDLTQPDQPFAVDFSDCYFSHSGGQAESAHVFLAQNHLPERWQQHPRSYFTIGETGFGTGLNFLVAWAALRQHSSSLRLHFISTERFPIHPQQLAIILQPWRHTLSGVAELLDAYQYLVPGWNRMSFADAELTLWIGDATAGLNDLNAQVDAWFLDGFAPERNPELWHPQLFQALAQHSHAQTTLATYTVATDVRAGLAAAGFHCEKRPGFGAKKHCLAGYFIGQNGPREHTQSWARPQSDAQPNIGIIGAGVATVELVSSARRRGLSVSVIAPEHTTLGAIQAAVYARPGLEADPSTMWYAQALSYRLRRWQQVGQTWPGQQSGLLQLMSPERWHRIQQHFDQHPFAQLCTPIDAKTASTHAGTSILQPALWFPSGGWLSLQNYIEQHWSSSQRIHARITDLSRNGEQWRLHDEHGQSHDFSHVIVAMGAQTAQWPLTQHLPLQPVRGQITAIQGSPGPNCVICGQRYATPNNAQGIWHVGSTFQPNQQQLDVQAQDRAANQRALNELAPELMQSFLAGQHTDAVGIRAATPDRLPMAGPLVNASASALPWQWHQLQYHPGLWVMTGLGSKGLTSAPLLAEYLICQITGEPLPFGHQTEQRIHAERFWRKSNAKP